LEWRKEFQVEDILKACSGNEPNDMTSVIQQENETCKIYVRGYDQDGRALLYMRPAKENTKDAVNNVRHVVWNLEKAIACSSKQGRSKICIVIDYDGFALLHAPPFSTSRYILEILQNHYPERMHKAYICNPPFVFRYVLGRNKFGLGMLGTF
jgi:CRAL/TRIO domain